ncbi:MAG: peptidyl-prolyl cis-trans isomerase [Pseudomonadales bacterium]|jgi:peptidyl-prolyl cis-trans isomerase D|nr:peptidyl-prolyl cis-trans isomerase [Pseudomonadales bacterium]
MLQKIRDTTKGAASKVIIYPLIFIFSLWGLDTIVGNITSATRGIEVDGADINDIDIDQLTQQKAQEYLRALPPDADLSNYSDAEFREAAVNELIQRTLLNQLAERNGMAISDDAIDFRIKSNPDFQINGQYNDDRANLVLRSVGYSNADYRAALASDMLLNQQLAAYSTSGFATSGDIARIAALTHQKRSFRYVTIALSSANQELSVSEDDIAAYYAANQSAFMRPEQVKLSYIELNREALLDEISVDESAVRAAYDAEVATYNAAIERRASHILFEAGSDEEYAAAEAKAKEVKARLDAGEDFAALAAEFSADTGSAQDGGDVGYTTGDNFTPAFESALQALAVDQVSEPVRTDFGYHLIKLTEISSADIPSFDDRRADLERALKQGEADELFAARTEELSNLAFESLDLQEPSTQMNLPIQNTDWVGRTGGADIAAGAGVIAAAFAPEVLEERLNSDVIRIDANRSVVIHVDDHRLSEPRPLEEVQGEITALLFDQGLREQARSLGEGFVRSLQAGDNIDALLQTQNQSWTQVDAAERSTPAGHPELMDAVFSAPAPAAGATLVQGVQISSGDYVIFEVQSVTPGTVADFEEGEEASLRNFINQQSAANDFVGFMLSLEHSAKIKGKENYLSSVPAADELLDEEL